MANRKSKETKEDKENPYLAHLQQVKAKVRVGDFLAKWSAGIWYYQITDIIPLDQSNHRDRRIVADYCGKPPASAHVWSFSDLVQFSHVELHERELDGTERIVVVPDYLPIEGEREL